MSSSPGFPGTTTTTTTGTTTTGAAAPPAVTRSPALLKLSLTELKLLSRERVRMALPIAVPLVLLIILGSIHSLRQPVALYGGASFIDIYTTTLVVMGLALLALTNMPMMLADYRERGVLRRLQTTPIGPVRVLVAQLVADLTIAVAMVVLILAVARIGFAVPLPRQPGAFVLSALLAAAALLAAGLLVAAIAPTGRVARGIGALLFYPMMFFAGLWLPIPNMPATLQHISHATPLGAAGPALAAATAGSWPTALQLLTLAAWAVALGLAAARFFRWE
jgi:ABC-2 type transport system permease protein